MVSKAINQQGHQSANRRENGLQRRAANAGLTGGSDDCFSLRFMLVKLLSI